MTESVRLKCLHWLMEHFRTMPDDGYTVSFSVIGLGPLTTRDTRKQSALGLVPGTEVKTPVYPFETCRLPIAVDFRYTVNQGGGSPGDNVEDVLAQVQKRIREAGNLGGLAADYSEMSNEIDLESYSDKTVSGVVMTQLQYRHHMLDPYEQASPP